MRTELSTPSSENEKPLEGDELRDFRQLAGFSTASSLERCAGLRPGRVANIENGRARFRSWEWVEVKSLLLEAMADRAREIAKHLPAGGAARTEGPKSSAADSV
jgi:transcriptional regulator with XRE-family HTH domain